MTVELIFLGAAQTVTGSKFWLKVADKNYLIDCGLFQGPNEIEQLNWGHPHLDPLRLDAVILTHAHLDHSGYLPRLVKNGFQGPVYASQATCALLDLLLPDSGYLQEEQAAYANKKGHSRYKPALPLYTYPEALQSLRLLRPVQMSSPFQVDGQLRVTMRLAGHILGSAILECDISSDGGPLKLVFSGDLGRYQQEFMKPPATLSEADYLIVESTYGDRIHPQEPIEKQLSELITEATEKGGTLLIPSFAVGRAQQLLYYLKKLEQEEEIPNLKVYLDSPMAIDATDIYCRFGGELNLDVDLLRDPKLCPLRCRNLEFVRASGESKVLDHLKGPRIIISASGMCEGGRVLHHLKHLLPDPKNTILFVGYQAKGTRGRLLLDGAHAIQVHGEEVPGRAHIRSLETLSAHADSGDILRWLSGFNRAPLKTFIVHGEPTAATSHTARIERELGWQVLMPNYLESATLVA